MGYESKGEMQTVSTVLDAADYEAFKKMIKNKGVDEQDWLHHIIVREISIHEDTTKKCHEGSSANEPSAKDILDFFR